MRMAMAMLMRMLMAMASAWQGVGESPQTRICAGQRHLLDMTGCSAIASSLTC